MLVRGGGVMEDGIKPAPGQWDPTTHPYRATFIVRSSSRHAYGWTDQHMVFQSEAGARHWLDTHKPAAQVKERALEVVDGYTGRGSNWRWRRLPIRRCA